MSGKFSMDQYIDVAERIAAFNNKYPEGSLQTITWSVEEIGQQAFIVYRAAAFRTPDDCRPGHGIAWEPFPGTTQFTRNSELMNAETAAWGRAIVALGLPSNKKIASKQEVRARAEEQQQAARPREVADVKPRELASAKALESIAAGIKGLGWKVGDVRLRLTAVGVQDVSDVRVALGSLTPRQADELWDVIEAAAQEKAAA